MNRKQTPMRILGLALLMCAFNGTLSAQTDSLPSTETTRIDKVIIESEDKGPVSDTTEIAWRDKKFVIISENGVKRVEIIEHAGKAEGSDNDDDDEFDPEYDSKEEVDGKKKGYSKVDGLALDLGLINFYGPSGFGADAIATAPDLAVRDFRFASHVALHLFPTTVSLIGRGAVNLKSAITIDWSSYYFTGNATMVETDNGFEFQDTGVEFDKNKLTTRYAQIPLLLNFNTDPRGDDGVSISVGGFAGLLWNARTKQVSDANGTVKQDGDFGLNQFRYGLMGRIDFKWFDFYVMYNLSPMFEDSTPTDAQTVMAGVNIINF